MFRLFRRKAAAQTNMQDLLEIYKILVEMADRVSQRRQAANNFYLSVNTALVGVAAFFETKSAALAPITVCVAGCLISVLWSRGIESYRSLNKAKFEVIQNVEKSLIIQPYTDEWSIIDPVAGRQKHTPFYKTERTIPFVFIFFYTIQIIYFLPWARIRVGFAWFRQAVF